MMASGKLNISRLVEEVMEGLNIDRVVQDMTFVPTSSPSNSPVMTQGGLSSCKGTLVAYLVLWMMKGPKWSEKSQFVFRGEISDLEVVFDGRGGGGLWWSCNGLYLAPSNLYTSR